MDKETSSDQKLSEIMKNIVIYVEVRTGEDNRSEGIKKVISSLGAKVNNRLTKNTTHVIFKDGLLSTYKKAKQMNIPLVSILWIEACKKNFKVMDPSLFQISNKDRYEFPEMYEKIKRIKNMQPDAIDAKNRLQNIKQSQKNMAKQLDSPILSNIKVPRIPRTPKDNLNNILSEFQDKIMSTPDNDESFVFKSKLLQKIQNSPFSTKVSVANSKKIIKSPEAKEINNSTTSNQSKISNNSLTIIRESSRIRKPNSRLINDSFVNSPKIDKKLNRRRTIASTPNQSKINGSKDLSSYFVPITTKTSICPVIQEGNNIKTPDLEIMQIENSNNVNMGDEMQSRIDTLKENEEYDNTNLITPNNLSKNIIQRRTLYTPQNMEFSPAFKSAGKPKNYKRRTLFDISLDIIDKSLKNINDQLKTNKTIIKDSVITDDTEINRMEEVSDIPSTPIIQYENTPVKKRKLFMPDQFELSSVADFNKSLLSSTRKNKNGESVIKNLNKKRRITINTLVPTFKENRRSSFDFDKFPKGKIILPASTNESVPKTTKVLVCTNLHKDQLEFVERVVKSLGGFIIEPNVTDKTTHVVSLECRRTINIIKGIICGLWILKYDWIIESFNKGKWLYEESYELREFSRSVEICRSERQAFGPTYRMEIFSGLAKIYVSNKCKVPIDSLKDIIKLCSGQLINDPAQCKYVIGEYYEEKICLQPQWILDCITNNKIMKFSKYIINFEN